MATKETHQDPLGSRDNVADPSEEIGLDQDPEARRKIVNRLKRRVISIDEGKIVNDQSQGVYK